MKEKAIGMENRLVVDYGSGYINLHMRKWQNYTHILYQYQFPGFDIIL